MTTTKKNANTTPRRITIRRHGATYRVSGIERNFRSHQTAFAAAWQAAKRAGAALYVTTPAGEDRLLASARLIREVGTW